MFDTIGKNLKHDHLHIQNRFAVIPTADKLHANLGYAGRGVRIAFLDSGFYPHPDYAERVVCFHDISEEERSFHSIIEPKGHHWHGTQTVVSCAGDGSLSDGVYRGLAYEAELVLVKISKNGRISDESIEKGLQWVIENREKYKIRVLNISLVGDCDLGSSESRIIRLAEELVGQGVVIAVAAGNSTETRSIPPANSPSVITVGGYSDENRYISSDHELYHSSFGETIDGFVKPEIIAPAMYVAAPILPGTDDYDKAEILSMLAAAPDYSFRSLLDEFWKEAGLEEDILRIDIDAARKLAEYTLYRRKVIATHYQHVDGTSFATPITASVAAQMLETNPKLTPAAVKNILTSTASRLAGHPAIRQGFGVLDAGLAVEKALDEEHFLEAEAFGPPRIVGAKIVFNHHDDLAVSVNLAGDFNDWKEKTIAFAKCSDGLWKAEIPCQPSGKHTYKFLIDRHRWTEDASHGFKEEDGYGGFNSILMIE
jgi:serine protease AprX